MPHSKLGLFRIHKYLLLTVSIVSSMKGDFITGSTDIQASTNASSPKTTDSKQQVPYESSQNKQSLQDSIHRALEKHFSIEPNDATVQYAAWESKAKDGLILVYVCLLYRFEAMSSPLKDNILNLLILDNIVRMGCQFQIAHNRVGPEGNLKQLIKTNYKNFFLNKQLILGAFQNIGKETLLKEIQQSLPKSGLLEAIESESSLSEPLLFKSRCAENEYLALLQTESKIIVLVVFSTIKKIKRDENQSYKFDEPSEKSNSKVCYQGNSMKLQDRSHCRVSAEKNISPESRKLRNQEFEKNIDYSPSFSTIRIQTLIVAFVVIPEIWFEFWTLICGFIF